jgi:Flp pilus assembly protein TadD
MKRSAALLAAAVVLFATSCKPKSSSENAKVPITPSADSAHGALAAATPFQTQLDSGNVAFRAKDYSLARAHFMHATEIDSTNAAAWFGVYMAEDKLGNKAQADYAIKRAQQLNPAFKNANPHDAAAKQESKT